MHGFRTLSTSTALAGLAMAAAALGNNNLNPENSLCLDLRGAGAANAEGTCLSADAECEGAPIAPGVLQCTDNDHDPLNGGACVDRACYGTLPK